MWCVEFSVGGKATFRVFDDAADKDAIVTFLWKKGARPAVWEL